MTPSDTTPAPTPYPPRRLTLTLEVARPWVVVLWAAFIFFTGAIAGASLLHLMRPGPPPRGPHTRSPLPRDFAEHMQHDLGLSDEQTLGVERVVEKYEPIFEQTTDEARQRLKADLEQMNQEILPLLDDQQRTEHLRKWRDMLDPRHPPHHGPPPRHGPPRP